MAVKFGTVIGDPQVVRWNKASKVKELEDVDIPELRVWNYSPCEHHETPQADCQYRKCGGKPFRHQNITATFSYLARRSKVANSTGTGKQQPVSEPVLTPSGWRSIGDLRPGDFVIGSDGTPTEVLSVHPQAERRVFKVTFNDGSWTLTGPDHLWTAGTKARLHQGGSMKVVTTQHMMDTLHRSWVIPMVRPVEYPQADQLPCDPYLLGVVLGDGSINKYGGSQVTTDTEILVTLGASAIHPHATSSYTSYGTISVDLLGGAVKFPSRSWEKEIPERFMRGTSEDRLALLQGLMDSDGTPQHTGGTEFSTTSEVLANQVVELGQSLGGVVRIQGPRVTTYTHNGELREGRPSWRVNVKLPSGVAPFRLQRKLDKWVPPTKYPPRRIVKSVEQVEDQDSVCIRVAAEDSLYVTRNHIVTHNTNSSLLTLALADHFGETVRAIAVVPSTAVGQWVAETERWVPGFKVRSIPPKTPKSVRLETYAADWNILVIGYHVYTKDFNPEKSGIDPASLKIRQIIIDDVDPALKIDNVTYKALEATTKIAEMVIETNATSLQMNLMQLYAATCLIGAQKVWGSKSNFERNFIQKEKVSVWTKEKQLRNGKMIMVPVERKVFRATGVKNINKFKQMFKPMSIRFTYEDIKDDVTIPALVAEQVFLEMSPKQKARYAELQEGVRTILDNKAMPAEKKAVSAMTAFTIGSQICAGTFALKTTDGGYEPDHPDASPKLNWIMSKLTDEWMDEKVVIYSKFRGSISTLQQRLTTEDIGYATIWGVEPDPDARKEEMDRFWNDPKCRVMIISVSGERSLNLQNASILVMWDMQLNPARVHQLAGRVRRAGSKNKKVYVFELLHTDTQEERYITALAARQALFDVVYDVEVSDEGSDSMLIEKLDPEQLLRLIRP